MINYRVRLYSQENCSGCRATKAYLGKYGIKYEEINLSLEPEFKQDLFEMGFQSVPVVTSWVGFRYEEWSGFRDDMIKDLAGRIEAAKATPFEGNND